MNNKMFDDWLKRMQYYYYYDDSYNRVLGNRALYNNGIIYPHDNVYHRNCNKIKEILKQHDIKCSVSRHDVFGVDYYVLKSDDRIPEDKMAKILKIPEEWIGFMSAIPWIYYIKEKEFNNKYCDEKGEIIFELNSNRFYIEKDGINYCLKDTKDDFPVKHITSWEREDLKEFCDWLNKNVK